MHGPLLFIIALKYVCMCVALRVHKSQTWNENGATPPIELIMDSNE